MGNINIYKFSTQLRESVIKFKQKSRVVEKILKHRFWSRKINKINLQESQKIADVAMHCRYATSAMQ